ncbi:MAG: DUF1990 domain-containing protein [Deltaproteobacteria bacterium]|nr:DUF1990 domain-containing protein [Deltaproteobacteria bacterium]
MFALTAPSEDELATFLREQTEVALSYPEVGGTRDMSALPPGYTLDHRKESIGIGEGVFERARVALDTWAMHRGAGVHLVPVEPPREGLTVVLVVKAGVYTVSACRVVYTISEPGRFGFAYGTLEDHPVAGEERFLVEREPGGDVTLELSAFSRPSSLLFKLASPIARRKQLAIGGDYIEALRRLVTV